MSKSKILEYSNGPINGPLTKFRVKLAPQCKNKNNIWGDNIRCQGLDKHKGPHWAYKSNGWLTQWQSKKNIKSKWDWAVQVTPPDHKDYIHPKEKIKEWYANFNQTKVVGQEPAESLPKKIQSELNDYKKYLKSKKTKI
jgi:hypothetical protein